MTTNGARLLEDARTDLNEVLTLAQVSRVPESTAGFALLLHTLDKMLALLGEIKDATIQPALLDSTEGPEVFRVLIVTAGDEEQGPPIEVPWGYPVLVRQRNHTGTPTGYVSFRQKGTQHTNTRLEFGNNDSIHVDVSNLNQIFLGANSDATSFELVAATFTQRADTPSLRAPDAGGGHHHSHVAPRTRL
jgi:hypothetical protein